MFVLVYVVFVYANIKYSCVIIELPGAIDGNAMCGQKHIKTREKRVRIPMESPLCESLMIGCFSVFIYFFLYFPPDILLPSLAVLWVLPTNTGIFLRGLKLYGESRTYQMLLVSQKKVGGNHAFFRDKRASI